MKSIVLRIVYFCELVVGSYIGIWIARNWL